MDDKVLWVSAADDALSWEARKKYVTEALEAGASAVIVRDGEAKKVKELGSILVLGGADADYKVVYVKKNEDISSLSKKTIPFIEIRSKEDERRAVLCAQHVEYIIVNGFEWKIIPYENLIAEVKGCKIISVAKDVSEAKLNLGTLERGTDGILLLGDVSEIKKVAKMMRESAHITLPLVTAVVTSVKEVGMGDRVCIDTCSMLKIKEGMLIGSQSSGLFFVHSETIESPYVETRPFRVNAGAVHSYIMAKNGKTHYLSEVKAGDELLSVTTEGIGRTVIVGRAKIESRPLILIEAEYDSKIYKVILQNAETIRVVNEKSTAVSVNTLKKGDKILLYVESGARHFGTKVDETIIER